MIFVETRLRGAYIIELEPHVDERGFFARTFCREEFIAHGLNPDFAQCDISFNKKQGTLRGLHYQTEPFEEVKLVRCSRGAIYDVVIDLRPESPTHRQWMSVELTQENHKAVYIPEGFAHGFQTLHDNSEVLYQMSEPYHPDHSHGIRWDDPALGITWPPASQRIISAKDLAYPWL
ncbi:MAG: dTDP-4-dehydrorhamnose 3,5-epimerase [Sulfuricaulis sp.]|uniref:dTDP-4-dehydrorhamnose 3,5-epimerase n=1 Tax=Sulfuricaulis sp. TaxID=2003553 RepID=UPI0025D06DA5|nr:dTDP-4-dehydrorhamnose 3,5-epimerase [Sulfuricaulis sp.]MCR4346781.1 dTDP-4-dehydrorhamnose 3,5-epimerase [Sulfuricaulis sp.]